MTDRQYAIEMFLLGVLATLVLVLFMAKLQ